MEQLAWIVSFWQELHSALKVFNFLFTSVFILEAIAKIVALGFVRYTKDRSVHRTRPYPSLAPLHTHATVRVGVANE